MNSIFKLFILLSSTTLLAQSNLIDQLPAWTVGTGATTGYSLWGTTAENYRAFHLNPYGDSEIVWVADADATAWSADGGWNTSYFSITNTSTYRFSVWIKKLNSTEGETLFGLSSNTGDILLLNGSVNSNPYFWRDDLPELDKWYLLVGFVYSKDYTGSGSDPDSGIRDPTTGQKVLEMDLDFKFSSNSTNVRSRAYLYNNTSATAEQYFWDPTIFEVNGQEPTITELLNGPSSPSPWAEVSGNLNYTSGNVGIGHSNPTDKLEVNGTIHSKGVRADMNGWPDYVFEADYELPPLADIEKYIEVHGHLPNMPSAAEVASNGILLGEMNKRLLEKVEELTLYTLQENNTQNKLWERIELLLRPDSVHKSDKDGTTIKNNK